MRVGPSLVGRFVGDTQSGERPGAGRVDRNGPAFSGFVIPAGFEGTLVLAVGHPASDGEPYRSFSNAFSEGEPLACSGAMDAVPSRAVEIVEDRGLDAMWMIVSGDGSRPVDAKALASGAHDELVIVQAIAVDPIGCCSTSEPDHEVHTVLTSPAAC